MKIKLFPTKDRYNDRPECPFCHHRGEYETIQWEDYVEYPMLWCDKCGARAVLDPKSYHEFNNAENEPPDCVEIPLLFIERAVDSAMAMVKSTVPLTEEQMVLLTHSGGEAYHKYDKKVRAQLGLTKRKDEDFDDMIRYDHTDEKPDNAFRRELFNVSVAINSYNAEKPSKPHTAKVSLDHDGIYVFLQVVELDGTKSMIVYWGD